MADASLDDFFAKKDKSKKKPKKQINDSENQVDCEPEKKAVKKKKDKSKKKKENENKDAQPAEETPKEENEWNDFEDNTVDLTGLRIAPLQAKPEKEEEEQNGEEDEEGEDGEGERKPRTQDGPWQKGGENDSYQPPPQEAEPIAKATPVVGGKYVPPSRRGMGGESMSKANRRKKEAPNINSDMDFPTLGLGGKPHSGDGGGRFEEVGWQGSNRQTNDPSKRTQALELGNKFGALTDNNY